MNYGVNTPLYVSKQQRYDQEEWMQNFPSNYSPGLMGTEDFLAQSIRNTSIGATEDPSSFLSSRDGGHCGSSQWR